MGLLVAGRHGIPVALHTPTEVKAAVTGSGRADKAQVTAMVTRLLRLPGPPRPADAADAVAIAICQLWRGQAPAHGSAARGRRRPDDRVRPRHRSRRRRPTTWSSTSAASASRVQCTPGTALSVRGRASTSS